MTTFEFGPFRLDPSDRQLLRAGLPVALPPKVFDALHLLVERRGRLVGKEELMATLWPEAIVEEVTLARMISSLRKVLGDSPSARSYIETVSKFGYRFVAAVAEFDAAPALGSVAVHFTVRLPAGVHPARFPTAGSMALSPDGSLLALVATQHGRPALWVRDLAALEAVPLAGTEGAASPFWAPDGRDIAFFANGTLRRTSRRGGHVATLCEAPFGNAGTWGADDVLLFTEWAGGREGLYRISSSGGTPQRLSLHGTAGPERGIAWPAFLPDGRRFVYLGGALGAGNDGGPVRMIGVGSLDSSLITHLGPADSQPLPIAGDRLVFAREASFSFL